MAAIQRKGSGAAKKSQKSAKVEKKVAQRAPAKTPKNKGGRPKFEPTDAQRKLVTLAAGIGMKHERICHLITWPDLTPIGLTTLRERFADELDQAEAKLEVQLAGSMYGIAMDKKNRSAATAGIFLLKSRFKWREPEPEWAEKKRLGAEASAKAVIGDQEIVVTLVLEEPMERPIYGDDEPAPEAQAE